MIKPPIFNAGVIGVGLNYNNKLKIKRQLFQFKASFFRDELCSIGLSNIMLISKHNLISILTCVIPVKTGIQLFLNSFFPWIPAFTGMTALITIKIERFKIVIARRSRSNLFHIVIPSEARNL